jgi:site-specific recombinase XerD
VFTAPHGGPATDEHFRNRVCDPAIAAAGVRRFPPRIMRHTETSFLVQGGVPLHDVHAPLGHEDCAPTRRYRQLGPGAHGKVIESWTRRLGAPVAHAMKETRPS